MMSKKKHETDVADNSIDEPILFARVAKIMEGVNIAQSIRTTKKLPEQSVVPFNII